MSSAPMRSDSMQILRANALHAAEYDGKALVGECHGQRQAHIAQADDGDGGGAVWILVRNRCFMLISL